MAGARIADSLTEYNNIKKGFMTQGLTNWFTITNTDRPAIPAGFTIEIGGSVYQFASEDVIDIGALSGAQRLYVVITVDSADVVSAEFSTTFPATFNTALNGWYDGADRYLPYSVYWDGAASYTSKYLILPGALYTEDIEVDNDVTIGGQLIITGSLTTITASGNYVVPEYRKLIAIAIGGGGGGAGGSIAISQGNGGGGGGAGYVTVSEITPQVGSDLAIVVGAAGAGGAGRNHTAGGGSGSDGTDGTLSSITDAAGELLMDSNAGSGGKSNYVALAVGGGGYYLGGDGGDGSIGKDGENSTDDGYTYQKHGIHDINIKRGGGGGGGSKETGPIIYDPGIGKDGGGNGGVVGLNGVGASSYGSGGGGGGATIESDSVSSGSGGNGDPGVVYIVAM